MFYFTFELKIEFIPYIQKEIATFLTHFERNIEDSGAAPKLYKLLNKKIEQIDQFYYQHWSDFRANLILTSKQMLIKFKQEHFDDLIRLKLIGSPKKEQINNSQGPKGKSFINSPQILKSVREVQSNSGSKITEKNNSFVLQDKSIDQSKEKQKKSIGKNQFFLTNNSKNGTKSGQKFETERKKDALANSKTLAPQKEQDKEKGQKLTKQEFIKYLKSKNK